MTEWNVLEFYLGRAGAGKSYLMARRVHEVYVPQCYVLAHDLTGSFRGMHVHRMATADPAAVQSRLHARPVGILCLDVADGLAVLDAALAIAPLARRQGVNLLVCFDELVKVHDATGRPVLSPSFCHPRVLDAVMCRRHNGIGFLFGTQRPQLSHPSLYDDPTVLYLFGLSMLARPRLNEMGIPPGIIEKVTARDGTGMPAHAYYEITLGEPPRYHDPAE